MMRRVIEVVRTAAILDARGIKLNERHLLAYLVTMVRTVSLVSVGLMMNQNSKFVMLTIQIACMGNHVTRSRERMKKAYTVKVQAIAKHQLPWRQGFFLKRANRTLECEYELRMHVNTTA